MKSIRSYAAPGILAVALFGCNLDVQPIASATYTTYVAGSPGPRKELTGGQRQALAMWLGEHHSGWSRSFVSHVPRTLISLQHVDGAVSTLNFWPHLLIAYGQFGQYQRALSEDEARVLADIFSP